MYKINLLKSILAGMAISIAATAYLSVENSALGGVLFGIGLITIYMFGWNLYTGKCCYLPESVKINLPITAIAFAGNLIGTAITGYALRLCGLQIVEKAQQALSSKLAHTYIESFVLAIFCGILMSIAVLGYKLQKDDFGRALIIILPITVFIVAKFEHVVANMFYISLANAWGQKTVVFTIICAVGNAIGCCLIPVCQKIIAAKSNATLN